MDEISRADLPMLDRALRSGLPVTPEKLRRELLRMESLLVDPRTAKRTIERARRVRTMIDGKLGEAGLVNFQLI
jgi:hypothetical protein